MVVILDVDDFLRKDDFLIMVDDHVKWPWLVTHFCLAQTCFGCGFSTALYSTKPQHFIISTSEKVKDLLNYDFFWCQCCQVYAIYNHFTEDECEYCF